MILQFIGQVLQQIMTNYDKCYDDKLEQSNHRPNYFTFIRSLSLQDISQNYACFYKEGLEIKKC